MWPDSCFSTTASLSARHAPLDAAGHRDLQHHPLVEVPAPGLGAGDEALQRRAQPGRFDLGEVAEHADVDAEERHGRAVEQAHGAQHRAVAAEADDEVGLVERLLADEVTEPELGGVVGDHPRLVAALDEPGDGVAGERAAPRCARGGRRGRPWSRATSPGGSGDGVDEELPVALAAEDRRVDPADDRAAGGDQRRRRPRRGRARGSAGSTITPRPGRPRPCPPRTGASRAGPSATQAGTASRARG